MRELLHAIDDPADRFLENLGYRFVPANVLDAERRRSTDPVLAGRLAEAIRRLNPSIGEEDVRLATRCVADDPGSTLMDANEHLHRILVSGARLERGRGEAGSKTVRLVDFDTPENNEFVFTELYDVKCGRHSTVFDVLVFVNGIPLVVIEWKRESVGEPIDDAVSRLVRYQEESEEHALARAFRTVQILIAVGGKDAKYGTVGTSARLFGEWRESDPAVRAQLGEMLGHEPCRRDLLVHGVLDKRVLLELVRDFIVFEDNGVRTEKKLARQAQFSAVTRVLEHIRSARQPAARSGIVWHSHGAGKSVALLFLAIKLRRLSDPSSALVVVSGRHDLDQRLVRALAHRNVLAPAQPESTADLRELFAAGAERMVVTSAQKFQKAISRRMTVSTRFQTAFIVIDEAFRSKYRRLVINLRRAFPNACLLGMTGAPIDKKGGCAFEAVGPYVHKYTIEQALKDGVTVPVFYEERRPLGSVARATRGAVHTPDRIASICADLLAHFGTHVRPNGFKAQIVVQNRAAAAAYQDVLDALGTHESAIVMSSNSDDPPELARWRTPKAEQQELVARFRDPKDPLSILIVCDVLFASFDARVEQVLYVDAPLKDRLLPAIARVNRATDGKDFGLIVDYFGDARSVEQTLRLYGSSDAQGALRPSRELRAWLESRVRPVRLRPAVVRPLEPRIAAGKFGSIGPQPSSV